MDYEGKLNSKKITRWNYRIILVILTVAVLCGVGIAFAVGDAVTGLSVTPEPVKIGTNAYIQFTLAQDAKVSINIYKDTGEHVRTLWNSLSKLAGAQIQGWDGKDKNLVLVTDGYYKIAVEAKDAAGNQIGYAEKTVKAARQPAISSVTDTPDPFNPALGEQSAINFSLSTDALVTVSIIKNYSTIRTVVANEPRTAGVQTVNWDGKDSSGNLVADGPVTYQIVAANPSEPTFKSTVSGTAIVEKDDPSITGFSITPDPLKISSNNMTIMYNLSEDAKVTLKIVDSNGATVKTILNAVAKKAGFNSSAWDGKNDAGIYISEGTYSVVVSAVDYANKPSGEQAKTFKAGYHPAISGFSATPSMFNPDDLATTTISYAISRDALVTVEIFNGYSKVATLADNVLQSAGTQTFTWDGKVNGVAVGDADYTVQINAVSPTVNTFFSTYKGIVTVEKGAPGITGVTLSPEPYKLGVNANLSIIYNLTENSNVYINVYRGDVLVRRLVDGVSKLTGMNSATWNGKDDAGNDVPEGQYTVTIMGVDRFGKSDQAQGNVNCGYQPALGTVSVTPVTYNPLDNVNAVVYYNLSNEAKVTLTILKGTIPVRTINAGVKPVGTGYVAWNGKDDAGNVVADGPYTYQLDAVSQVVDFFKSTFKGSITVESRGPVLSDLMLSPLTAKIGTNTYLKYTLSEPAIVTGQILKAGDRSVVRDLPAENKTAGGMYTVTWDTKDNLGALVTTGSYIMKFDAVDNFGKTTSAELGFQAAAVPVISNFYAAPADVDVSISGETMINYTVSENSMVSIKVFDANNTLIRILATFKSVPAGSDAVLWDSKNSLGAVVTGVFTAKIDASSEIGYFKAATASVAINVTGTPPAPPPSCVDCHQTFPQAHPVNNCLTCHKDNRLVYSPHNPTQMCSDCHGGHGSEAINGWPCINCHNEANTWVPQHNPDINALHTAPPADCLNCHTTKTNITKHTNPVTGQANDCNVCHQSTEPKVVTAINTANKNCAACHASASHEQVHTPTGIQADCTKCHIDNLVNEHLSNPTTQTGNTWTCGTCHDSTVAEVVYAINYSQKNCFQCHNQSTANHQVVHETTNLDTNCTTCHNNNLVTEHLNNPKTQTDPVTGQIKPWTCATCHESTDPTRVWAISSGNEQCSVCHKVAHGINLVEKVPADIPLYAGYQYSSPIDTDIYAGETWMPDEFVNPEGRVVISNRRTDVTGNAVYTFYTTQMAANGWTVQPHTLDVSDFFNLTFTKANRKVMIWFYGGANHTASPVLSAGYRLEVIYK